MVVILKTKNRLFELDGRTLGIILELAEMQDEIEETPKGEIKVSWKGGDLRISLSKYRTKRTRLAE